MIVTIRKYGEKSVYVNLGDKDHLDLKFDMDFRTVDRPQFVHVTRKITIKRKDNDNISIYAGKAKTSARDI
jgi:hypothetical protein